MCELVNSGSEKWILEVVSSSLTKLQYLFIVQSHSSVHNILRKCFLIIINLV